MYSLVFSSDIKEYYICRSRNVIQEDNDTCLVAFRGKVILTHDSKNYLHQHVKNNFRERLPVLPIIEYNEKKCHFRESLPVLPIIENKCLEPKREAIIQEEPVRHLFSNFVMLPRPEEMDDNEEEILPELSFIKTDLNSNLQSKTQTNAREVQLETIQNFLTTEELESPHSIKSKLSNKKYYCWFCKENCTKFVKHLETVHTNEKEVKQFMALPTDSRKRRNFIYELKMKSLKLHKSIIEKKKLIPNQIHHFRRLTRNRMHVKTSTRLKSICSKLQFVITKAIRNDETLRMFGNVQCQRYSVIQIRTQFKILIKILMEMKKHNCKITNLSLIFHRDNSDIFEIITKNKIFNSFGVRYLYKIGKLLIAHYISKKDISKKEEVEEFLKVLVRTKRAKCTKKKTNSSKINSVKKIHKPMITKLEKELNRKVHVPISTKAENESFSQNRITETGETSQEIVERDDLNQQNQHYVLRERQKNYEKFNGLDIITGYDEYNGNLSCFKSDNKKYYYCYFCKRWYLSHLSAHLERMHKEEEEVKRFCSLPKGSPERKKILAAILNKGKEECNISIGPKEKEQHKEKDRSDTILLKTEYATTSDNSLEHGRNENLIEECDNKYTDQNLVENEDSSYYDNFKLHDSIDVKDEDETKFSLMSMLEGHVNCLGI